MENEKNPLAAQMTGEPKPKLYDPCNYALIGLLFTLMPVFFMSHHNCRLLPNGEDIEKKMRNYTWLFILTLSAYVLLVYWASLTVAAFYQTHSFDNLDPGFYLPQAVPHPTTIALNIAEFILDQGRNALLIIHFLLLFMTLRLTNNSETPPYIMLKTSEQIEKKSALIPCVIGLAIALLLLSYAPYLEKIMIT